MSAQTTNNNHNEDEEADTQDKQIIALGFDPIWFGILFCVNMQVSFLSPPFGPAAFYLKSVAPPHISLTDIFRGFAPFIVIQLIVLACVMFFPEAMTQNFHEFKPKP